MAKTGKLAAFKLGEKKTAMVNLPAQFVTASSANAKGQKYSNLVDYANNKDKTDDQNNESITELLDLKKQFSESGYATRTSATTEQEPIFSSDKLHYNNHDISVLRKRLDKAQANGNNIHELAFSLRGDWLVENNLYDPKTGNIDQDKLKHAQQKVVKTLINQGFKLPLGESDRDVVWFGVIHQDTDHLNMHLWFAKETKEERPEMLKQSGPYKGQPTGVIPLQKIELAKREFRHELINDKSRQKRVDVLKGLGQLKNEIVKNSGKIFGETRYLEQIKAIYSALPQEQKGHWQIGNSSLMASNTNMAKANHLTNQLLNDMFQNEFKSEYDEFKQLAQQFDAFNIEDQGVMRKGQRKLSENKDEELRRRLANKLYRHFNEIHDNDLEIIDHKLIDIKSRIHDYHASHLKKPMSKTGLKENNIHGSNSKVAQVNIISPKNSFKKTQADSVMLKDNKSFSKINRIWQQDIRAETNAERQFLRNQKTAAREQQIEDIESQNHRTL
ncbi:MobP2 family relaxase [Leuconostoc citreum]|uniref:MobP2 family relaxase n=1 Tax=Leuconostoc citreum TaxID=33964 RepID=UPI0015F3C401|nr:MobP2 family relaxase [Leuconostoc citreum]MBA5937987.1 IS110 family transposase [Leuconostoc citreum]